ncbi:hypothetical protein [Lentibacter sp.]|uniref:hypothetical protein n=1 Tax=Lentibacter sp. TaxID=2024994 RepID=UPI003F6DA129
MITLKPAVLSLVAFSTLTACGASNEVATRGDAAPLNFATSSPELRLIDEQAETLQQMSRDLVRRSTGKGAAMGAAVGCGLGLISASNASKCVAGAVAGGAVGAVVGHGHGKRKVAARVATVSQGDMALSLRNANATLSEIKTSLPSLLAKQDAELKALKRQRAANTITEEAYTARLDEIRATRAKLADALMDSADKARTSADNLGLAASQGQSGLMWHIGAAKRLEEESISTRSTITLL